MRWCVLYVQMQVATGEIVGVKCFLRKIRELCMGAKKLYEKECENVCVFGGFFLLLWPFSAA